MRLYPKEGETMPGHSSRMGRALALSVPPLAALLRVLGGSSYNCDSDYYWHIALGRGERMAVRRLVHQ